MLQLNLFVKKLREIVCVETDLYDQSLHKQQHGATRGNLSSRNSTLKTS